jgi:hypothetical protein
MDVSLGTREIPRRGIDAASGAATLDNVQSGDSGQLLSLTHRSPKEGFIRAATLFGLYGSRRSASIR